MTYFRNFFVLFVISLSFILTSCGPTLESEMKRIFKEKYKMTNEEEKKEEVETKEEVKEESKKEEIETKEEVKEETKVKEKVETKEEVKEEPKTEEKKEVKVPSKFQNLVKEIEEMSVLDLSELVKLLEDKFGVSAAPQMMAGALPGGVAATQDNDEGKSTFSIVLTAVGDKKIQVIKTIRDITKKGLKDSKDLADAIASEPQVIKENAKKDEAEEIKKLFEEAGAKVELK